MWKPVAQEHSAIDLKKMKKKKSDVVVTEQLIGAPSIYIYIY